MARSEARYICQQCGQVQLTWTGRCPGCGEWNSLVEARQSSGPSKRGRSASAAGKPVPLRDVEAPDEQRLRTGVGELDRVLGGGLVPGSLVLLGGSPGIGKSTLTGMALANLAGSGREVLYVSGEESAAQVRLRAERLGDAALSVPALAEVAKRRGIALILVGHVTKEGSIAGPRVLEHLVDCVLQFEGDRYRSHRILRAVKNRFGSTNELGVFEMTGAGLQGVEDPSEIFGRSQDDQPGSAVVCALEGTRPLLLEIQALVSPSDLAMPRRVATGVDPKRLSMIVAVLGRHAGVSLGQADVFVNVAGGVRIDEPAADLGIALAIASAARGVRVRDGLACFGEVGLTGRLRPASQAERRLAECAKLGFSAAIVPNGTESRGKMRLKAPETLRQAIEAGLDD